MTNLPLLAAMCGTTFIIGVVVGIFVTVRVKEEIKFIDSDLEHILTEGEQK